MAFKYVIAIVRPEIVLSLEAKLAAAGVSGITLSRVKGFGEYKNFYSNDWLTEHTKAEVFVDEARLGALLDVLRNTTNADALGTGVVAVMPVDDFQHLCATTDSWSRVRSDEREITEPDGAACHAETGHAAHR